MSRTETPATQPVVRRRTNGWPVLPLRIFLAALFLFAGYAKLSYPGFFDPNSLNGLKASVDAAKHGTPIGGLLGPLSDHPSMFGHITAFAEIAIGLGLLVGLLTRIAAAGGIVLTVLIVLSIDWGGVKEYTGSSGWFTSVDLAVAAALSVFVLGGADALSLDNLLWRRRLRQAARDDAEPGFRDNELAESRQRLQGDHPTGQYPAVAAEQPRPSYDEQVRPSYDEQVRARDDEQRTERLPEPEPNSLWNAGRRDRDPDGTNTGN